MNYLERERLWDEFLARWPLDSLANMSLVDYTASGTNDSFVYWVETKTFDLGSIQGGTALKFGIYSQHANSLDSVLKQQGARQAGGYAWRESLGTTPNEAFAKVKQEVIEVAAAAREGRFDRIENSSLAPLYRWKLAFLYQDRQHIQLLPIYSPEMLARMAGGAHAPDAPRIDLHQALLAQRGDVPLLAYAASLWERDRVARTEIEVTEAAALELTERTDTLARLRSTVPLAEREALWDAYLARWPIEALERLTPADYGSVNDADSLVGWLNKRTASLGSISFKGSGLDSRFGIDLSRTDPASDEARAKVDALRAGIVFVAKAAAAGNLHVPAKSGLNELLAWKVAFLYQRRDQPQVLPLFNADDLSSLVRLHGLKPKSGKRLDGYTACFSLYKGGSALAFYDRLTADDETGTLQAAESTADEPPPHRPMATNTILFGPPGTGKTHATVDEALQILDPAFWQAHAADRTRLKARFDELAQTGRVRFVTFHQSLSYEDFVEGLSAESSDGGQLAYRVKNGVFKDLCVRASAALQAPPSQPVGPTFQVGQRKVWKLSLGAAFGDDAYVYSECISGNKALLGYGRGLDYSACQSAQQAQALLAQGGFTSSEDQFAGTVLHRFKNEMKVGDLVVVSEGNLAFRAIGEITGEYTHEPQEDGGQYCQARQVRWLKLFGPSLSYGELLHKKFSMLSFYKLGPDVIDMNKLKALLTESTEPARAEAGAFVLVIDEINRGNVSRVFGELLTLIEPSKRAGAPEALHVVLPYSRESFSVPANVHVVGTMNTADRSLAGLDIALRRRFTFKEMPPRPELLDGLEVAGVDLGAMLRVMNERIEVLLDRDHLIGHAYLLPLKEPGANTLERLSEVFRQQIVPLLQEYFFEDWERISWVLNDHMKLPPHRFISQGGTSSASALFGKAVADQVSDRRWRLNKAAFSQIESYAGIVSV